MTAASTVKVSYLGDSASLSRASAKAERSIGQVGDRAHKVGSIVGKALGGVAVAGIGALGLVLKTGLGEVKDYQTGVADLNNVLKTTHNVAGVSTKGMEDLASSIQDYSGQTDDSIVKTEGLLLTFTNIRNAAGKNNDIFTQATRLSADMAQKFGGEASDSAIKLGKALNDPTKGLTALSKIGVSFTEQQKKQIIAMQKSGDIAGAQKIILAELTKEVGGSAKAYGTTLAGQVDRAHRSFEDVSQSLATAMLPILTTVMTYVTTTALPAFKKFVDQMQNGQGAGGKFADVLSQMWHAAQQVGKFLMPIVQFLVQHPKVFEAVALSAAALATAFKVQALYGAIVAKFMPGLAVSTAAQGRAASLAAVGNARNAGAMRGIGPGLMAAGAITAPVSHEGVNKFFKPKAGMSVAPHGALYSSPTQLKLAEGGLVHARSGGTTATLAEAGEDELVTPLSKLGGMGGSQDITVNLILDGQVIHTALLRRKRSLGGDLGLT